MSEEPTMGRLRAGVERLHAAQLAALAGRGAGVGDVWGVLAALLGSIGTMGSVLMDLAQLDGAVAAEARKTVVHLAVEAANHLAELVGAALDLEGAAAAGGGPSGRDGSGTGPAAARRSQTEVMTVRALTDLNRLLVEQLQALFERLRKEEGWQPAPPGRLWLGLVRGTGELAPLAAALAAGPLGGADLKTLRRVTAEMANGIAFLRSYPRFPS
jgi:hypothetical protein